MYGADIGRIAKKEKRTKAANEEGEDEDGMDGMEEIQVKRRRVVCQDIILATLHKPIEGKRKCVRKGATECICMDEEQQKNMQQ